MSSSASDAIDYHSVEGGNGIVVKPGGMNGGVLIVMLVLVVGSVSLLMKSK